MIIKGLLELIYGLLKIVFSPISLPSLPSGIQEVVDQFVNIIVHSVAFLGTFVNLEHLVWLLPIVVIIANFERVWNLIMFILRKIPFIGVQ